MTLHELSEDESGRAIQAAPGDQVEVSLPETPGTGFRWELASTLPPEIVLEASTFAQASGSQVGGGGTRTFTFAIRDSTTARIELRRWRPWEGERSVDRTLAFEVDASNLT